MGLRDFVAESNRIEGIARDPLPTEIAAHAAFLALKTITVDDLCGFVAEIADAELRSKRGMDVRVGSHLPPPGGPGIDVALRELLTEAHTCGPYEVHVRYEALHPFMDGNGRSGRVLWAWQMRREGRDPFALSFLHRWYYESLEHSRRLCPSLYGSEREAA